MSLLGNILWILLGGGIFLFLEYLLGGRGVRVGTRLAPVRRSV